MSRIIRNPKRESVSEEFTVRSSLTIRGYDFLPASLFFERQLEQAAIGGLADVSGCDGFLSESVQRNKNRGH